MGRTVLTKVITLGAQMILARLLLQDEFGAFALCSIALAIANTVGEAGVKQVLVQRFRSFKTWSGPAFWITAATGMLGGLVSLAIIPIMASIYGPSLVPLLLVMSIEAFVRPMLLPAMARLQIDMRFGAIAVIGAGQTAVQAAVQIVLALMGGGAMSLAASRPAMTIAAVVAAWLISGQPIGGRFRFNKWKYLLGNTVWMLAAAGLWRVTLQSDKAILGLFVDKSEVGLYFVAFQVSVQTMMLISVNLQNVLLPVLSSMKGDPSRMLAAMKRGGAALAAIALPICASISIVARDATPVLFGERFRATGPILTVLSLALFFRAMLSIVDTTLQSRGQFKIAFFYQLWTALAFVACATPFAWALGAVGMAGGVLVHGVIALIIGCAFVFGDAGPRSAWEIVRSPLLAAIVPLIGGIYATRTFAGTGNVTHLVFSSAVACVFVAIYGGSLLIIDRPLVGAVLQPFRGRLPGPARKLIDKIVPPQPKAPKSDGPTPPTADGDPPRTASRGHTQARPDSE